MSLRKVFDEWWAAIRSLLDLPSGPQVAPARGASLPDELPSAAPGDVDTPAPEPIAAAPVAPPPTPSRPPPEPVVTDAAAPAAPAPGPADPSAILGEQPEPASTAMTLPADSQRQALEAKAARLEVQLAELAAQRAEMAERMEQFQLAQYQALGAAVEECLRLRYRLMQLLAAKSGEADDRAAEAAAEAEFQAYHSVCDEAAARPILDEASQEELKRLYRSAAMACHPDRVEEARRESAHDLFLRVQQAYRQGDLAALSALQREIGGTLATAEAAPSAPLDLSARIVRLQDQVADLILAIQTLQLDPAYRQAARTEAWQPFFTAARARFEEECEELRRLIRAQGAEA